MWRIDVKSPMFHRSARFGIWFILLLVEVLIAFNNSLAQASTTTVKSPFEITPELNSPQGQYHARVAFDGKDTYLVVWEQGADIWQNSSKQIYAARIRVIDGIPTVLDPGGIHLLDSNDSQQWPRLAFGSGVFLVVWQELTATRGYDIRGIRVNGDGKILDPTGMSISLESHNQMTPDVAYDPANGRFFLVWADFRSTHNYQIFGARVLADGTLMDGAGIPLTNDVDADSPVPYTPVVGTNGTKLLVAWSLRWRETSGNNLMAKMYDLDGKFVQDVFTVKAFHGDIYVGPDKVSSFWYDRQFGIFSNGTDFTILPHTVYRSRFLYDYPLPFYHVLNNGSVANSSYPLDIDTTTSAFSASALFTGSNYAIFWEGLASADLEESESNHNIYMVRVDRDVERNMDYDHPIVIADSSAAELNPTVAGGKNFETLVVYEEDNLLAHPESKHVLKARIVQLAEGEPPKSPPPSDASPPSVPEAISGTATSEYTITLSWKAANDAESGITKYVIYRDGIKIGESFTNSYTDTTVTPNTTYTYQVTAVNGSGLESTQSASIIITTQPGSPPPPRQPLSLPLIVKETAGVGVASYPIDVIVPLAKGEFADSDSFRVADSSDATVKAQFNILNTWPDGSIRHLKVHFQPTVAAFTGTTGSGTATYYFKSDGTGSSAKTELSVDTTSDPNQITVTTGPLKFTINKGHFTILDEAWLDTDADGSFEDETPIIASDAHNGGMFLGLWGTQYDSSRKDITYTVEERGPMRAVIKAWAPTLYYGADYKDTDSGIDKEHQHGFAVRIYAYAGKPYIKIDYQLQNSAKNSKWSWPLYFDGMGINFQLNLDPAHTTVRVDPGDGTITTRNLRGFHNGVVLKQLQDHIVSIEEGDDTSLDVKDWDQTWLSNAVTSTFLDADDGTRGVMVSMRNFWQTFPNGLALDAAGNLQFQLWPTWKCHWEDEDGTYMNFGACKDTTPDQSRPGWALYWLNDMQQTYKELFVYFHKPGKSDKDLQDLARTLQYHPVAIVPTSQYQKSFATLDMGGLIPISTSIDAGDARVKTYNDDSPFNTSRNKYKFGWDNFYLVDKIRKYGPSTTGGWPETVSHYIVNANPSQYYMADAWSIGELNTKPQWLAGYGYDSDVALGLNTHDYPMDSWRANGGSVSDYLDASLLPGSWTMAFPRDDQHGWFYHVEQAYYFTGNPWIKDWYKFIGQFRKGMLDDIGKFGDTSSRAIGHMLSNAIQAYRVTNDSEMLTKAGEFVSRYLRRSIDPVTGQRESTSEGQDSAMQVGYLCRALISFMEEVKDSDPQSYAEAFQALSGLMEWNYHYDNFGNYIDARLGTIGSSTCSGLTLADPQAWYYWHTGKQKYLDQLNHYIDSGINGGDRACGNLKTWQGQFEGRHTQYVREHVREDRIPPPKIVDLSAQSSGTQNVTLTWTAPLGAARYHIVYSEKPMSEDATTDAKLTNWWAAHTVGSNLRARPGEHQQLIIQVDPAVAAYVAIFSFDDLENMSEMSNVAQVPSEGGEEALAPPERLRLVD